MRADIHMDMVGGDPVQEQIHAACDADTLVAAHVRHGYRQRLCRNHPRCRDRIHRRRQSRGGGGRSKIATALSGTRNAFFVDETPYAEGSDHDDYDSSTIAVPSLYLRDWPDIYIHTDHDTLFEIDPTKLRRVALLGAASGYSFAALDGARTPALVLPFLVGARAATPGAGIRSRAGC